MTKPVMIEVKTNFEITDLTIDDYEKPEIKVGLKMEVGINKGTFHESSFHLFINISPDTFDSFMKEVRDKVVNELEKRTKKNESSVD